MTWMDAEKIWTSKKICAAEECVHYYKKGMVPHFSSIMTKLSFVEKVKKLFKCIERRLLK